MHSSLLSRFKEHKRSLESHFKKASEFLVKCQIIEPYVEKGTLHGCVCPWEIGESADEGAFPILEDFHDTLEAIWVWTFYTRVSSKQTFRPNIDWAWEYITKNWKRFISEAKEGKSLYDCSYILFSGTLYQKVFHNGKYKVFLEKAGNNVERHLSKVKSTADREYSDPYWMAYCLGRAAKDLNKRRWFRAAADFVKRTVVDVKKPFSIVEKEPKHKGPGGHDFFSKNANKALALMACISQEEAKDLLENKFLPCLPKSFVHRHADENAWNAHLATAIGKSYIFTGNEQFMRRYFMIIDELNLRDEQKSAALPRSPTFGRRESWVTFFYAHAYSSILEY